MKLGKIIASVHHKKNAYFNHQLKDLKLSHGQALVIHTIYHYGVIQQDQLTKDLEIDKSAVTRILKTLEERHYIKRCISQIDRRIYEITLTQKGKDVYPQIHHIIEQMHKTMLKGMTEEESQQVIYLLLKMKENLEEENE